MEKVCTWLGVIKKILNEVLNGFVSHRKCQECTFIYIKTISPFMLASHRVKHRP